MVRKIASKTYMGLIFAFLYLPILVLIVLSFNKSKSRVVWGGFTLDWYKSCFDSPAIMSAFATTLELTLLAALIATDIAKERILAVVVRNACLLVAPTVEVGVLPSIGAVECA